MQFNTIRKRVVIAALLTSVTAEPALASFTHHFEIYNHSSRTVIVGKVNQTQCVANVQWPDPIPPGESVKITWIDKNGSARCENVPEFVAFSIAAIDDAGMQYNGYVGVIQKKFHGSRYNGQFWAQSLQMFGDGPLWNDGQPPKFITPACAHNIRSHCFRSFSEMYEKSQKAYHLAHYQRSEEGGSFIIQNP